MRKLCILLALLLILVLAGCTQQSQQAPILATTKPVYDLTVLLCQSTGLEVGLLIDENISCLHDYSLSTTQMRQIENAQMVILSGAGLEAFPPQLLAGCRRLVEAAKDVPWLGCQDGHDHDGHSHESDPHIWLDPENAMLMAENICAGLVRQFPDHADRIQANLENVLRQLESLQAYGEEMLQVLSCRQIITFHDGFAYLAQAFGLEILASVEEESGSEASAQELIALIEIVKQNDLPAIFNEVNGSPSASGVIAAETGAKVYALNMAMGESDYFEAMYANIQTLKEALE